MAAGRDRRWTGQLPALSAVAAATIRTAAIGRDQV
jgi:hypothetical protein